MMHTQTDHLRQQVRQLLRQYQNDVARARQKARREGRSEGEVAIISQQVADAMKEKLRPYQRRCSHNFMAWAPAQGSPVAEERQCRCCLHTQKRPLTVVGAANDI